MSYGQGSIVKHGRRWRVTYWDKGKRHRESAASREAAVALLKQAHGEQAQGHVVGPIAKRLTLGNLLAMIEADHALAGRKSKAPTARLLEYFGEEFKVLDLTLDVLTQYATDRRARCADGAPGAAAQTVRNELATLGRGFTLAHRAGKLAQRPPLPLIRVRNVRSGFFENDDIARLLPHLPPYLRPLVETAYLTGMRRSELLGMQWRQVDWRAGEIRLESGRTKNDQGRRFPFAFHPRLVEVLREQRERVDAIQRDRDFLIPWVFCHDDGRQVAGWYGCAWRSALKAARLDPTMLFHDLRRSAVRNLVRSGVSEGVAMKLTGHLTPSVFRRYDITSASDLDEAVAKLARFHSGHGDRRVLPMKAKER